MSLIWAILWINAATGVALTAALIVFRHRFSLSRWLIHHHDDSQDVNARVSVIIAARNEAEAIEHTLRDLIAISDVHEIIVIDDQSDDITLEIIRNIAENESKLRVFSAPPLPQGWLGKTHAIHWGSQYATGDYLLFTDADIRFFKLPLGKIAAQMRAHNIDHVGGNFRLLLQCATEAVTGPVLGAIAFVALGISALFHGSGTGAFNLVKASVYRRLDGHASIKAHIVDDVALARMFRRHGSKSIFLDMSNHVAVRLYEGVQGYVEAVSRSAIPFLGKSPPLIFMLALAGVIFSATLILSPCLAFWNQGSSIIAITYSLSVMPYLIAGWLHDRSAFFGLLSPVGLLIMTLSVCFSAIRRLFGTRIRWRGRYYSQYE